MPRTVLEAMSVGRPIITTNAPGCIDTVKENISAVKNVKIFFITIFYQYFYINIFIFKKSLNNQIEPLYIKKTK